MLDAFIDTALGEVDDLAELKVTLAALWLIERKGGGAASIDAAELAAVPALRRGLGFAPDLAIESALKRAVLRGTLVTARPSQGAGPRYLWPGPETRRWVAEADTAAARSSGAAAARPSDAIAERLARQIERLEQVEAIALPMDEQVILEEWLAQGYSEAEIEEALLASLRVPRASGSPPRGLRDAAQLLKARPPVSPSPYYQWKTGALKVPPDGMVAFRERAGRWPTAAEYALIRAAIGLYGEPSTVQAIARLVSRESASLDALLPLLAEAEEARLALERAAAQPDPKLTQLQRLYESFSGLPPTATILADMGQLLAGDAADLDVWRAAFDYASAQNKRDWRYARAIALNPKPDLFVPQASNDTAQVAFEEYRRRVGRLDAFVAKEINALSATITDPARWRDAIDKAAVANRLRWDYIRAVLTGPAQSHGTQPSAQARPRRGGADKPGRGSAYRLPQVDDPTEAERAAARDRARQQRAERARKRQE